ncbi:hypothetical protein CERZMDRAFT_82406 [Cercospora zeae-maydis SCOH1-5]|uniref:Uncharacterized protein n=1 Tax=Cercospora zeae-maydis SCOH1-5 TaxID=717836 RepID=A0A6A6FQ15_9PEZI|nr:hypothetical protein CERZMDRAFT_82406 [Cercospora zeae-maydis SCOH1-5]
MSRHLRLGDVRNDDVTRTTSISPVALAKRATMQCCTLGLCCCCCCCCCFRQRKKSIRSHESCLGHSTGVGSPSPSLRDDRRRPDTRQQRESFHARPDSAAVSFVYLRQITTTTVGQAHRTWKCAGRASLRSQINCLVCVLPSWSSQPSTYLECEGLRLPSRGEER